MLMNEITVSLSSILSISDFQCFLPCFYSSTNAVMTQRKIICCSYSMSLILGLISQCRNERRNHLATGFLWNIRMLPIPY